MSKDKGFGREDTTSTPVVCNADYLFELYSGSDFLAIAQDRVRLSDGEGDPMYIGDFGFQECYDDNGVIPCAYEQALELEIRWLKAIRK